MEWLSRVAAGIGAATLFSTAYSVLSFLYIYIRPSSLPRYLSTSDGSPPWAFVTGATDGIGKAFAAELAAYGFNIIIHGRNATKLTAVRAALEAEYPCREFRTVTADASDLSSVDFPSIAGVVSDVSLKILVNNLGSTMTRGHEFDLIETYSAAELEANIAINATFPIILTGALMPSLAAHQPSLILNIGSAAELVMPLFPAYGPAKAALAHSAAELALEQAFAGRDIETMSMMVMTVTDTGTVAVPRSVMVPGPRQWVRSALGMVGCGRTSVTPHFLQALQVWMVSNLPSAFLTTKFKLMAIRGILENDPTGSKAEAVVSEAAKKEL